MMRGSANVMNSRNHPKGSLDFFPTPPWSTRAVLHELLLPLNLRLDTMIVRDPCVGGGHMLGPLREVFKQVDFADVHDWGINPPIRDFTFETIASLEADGEKRPDWIFANPPFEIAAAFFQQAFAIARRGVAFLVRASWLSGQERYNTIYHLHRPTFVAHHAERVAMIEGVWDPEASSATDYVWIIWIQGWVPQPTVWLRPGMQDKYTKITDMALATPGEAKRRAAARKAKAEVV
ncbi:MULTISPECIES: SAM-dependent DNA methyltransferase [Rhizobium/Agrobacterium group]|uniref:SAM-dependent DNA methyltransferase n=1 Tax=Rhizobium/Agrobacterium group TaxID=227290 RepID=UPI0012E93EF8|nr:MULTISPECIES: SAM-dependent DNA methyltransferase [Rhizobium/Agrobacterium group]MCF1492475.1 SAM-dependent DNA methyltransferase [Allorhizobium ampelinum]MVA44466.1 SAM-dependent DNA methyltransferase [Agrobacterium vitis]WEO73800.1 SAM-dependent DNA methyltransferase [Agrobacterium vitis]